MALTALNEKLAKRDLRSTKCTSRHMRSEESINTEDIKNCDVL